MYLVKLKTMEGENKMNIEDKIITISFSCEDFDRAISKLESLDALLQETVNVLKKAKDNSLTKNQAF